MMHWEVESAVHINTSLLKFEIRQLNFHRLFPDGHTLHASTWSMGEGVMMRDMLNATINKGYISDQYRSF